MHSVRISLPARAVNRGPVLFGADHGQTGRNWITSCLPTIHSVAESGGLSDERCFSPIGRSASQCCRPVNDDNLTASFCNRHLRFRSVTVRARKRACEWFAEFARRLNRHDQFATDICDIRTADFIELPCRCKTYPSCDTCRCRAFKRIVQPLSMHRGRSRDHLCRR